MLETELADAQDPGNLVNAVHDSLPWSVSQIETFEHMLMSDEMRLRYPGRLVSFREIDHNIYGALKKPEGRAEFAMCGTAQPGSASFSRR